METASIWHNYVQDIYEKREAALSLATAEAELVWKDLDELQGRLDDTIVSRETVEAIKLLREHMKIRETRVLSPAILEGLCLTVLEQFEQKVIDGLVENPL